MTDVVFKKKTNFRQDLLPVCGMTGAGFALMK